MTNFSRRSLTGFLFFQFALLLILKPDQALSFGPPGLSAAHSTRHSLNAESSLAFGRSRETRGDPAACRQSLITTRKIQQRTHNTDSRLNAVMDIVGVSPEPIHTAIAFATFGPQPFWLLMILLPNTELTKKIMGKMGKKSLFHGNKLLGYIDICLNGTNIRTRT